MQGGAASPRLPVIATCFADSRSPKELLVRFTDGIGRNLPRRAY